MNSPEISALLTQFLQTRSPALREQLTLASVPLVHYLLGRMGISQETSPDYEDLAHQGLLGLLEAIDHFDPRFNTRFSTYASLRIRGKVLDYLRAADWMPRSARKRTRLVQTAIAALWAENRHEPTESEIASRLGLDAAEVEQALCDSNRILLSLDALQDTDREADTPLHERIADEAQTNPSQTLEAETLVQALEASLHSLPQRQQLVLALYYNEELTFKEIGKTLHITESRVCQLHARAILSLKAMMKHDEPL